MTCARLFIGADNTTGRLDLDALQRVADAHLTGYTLTTGQGRWEGAGEPCAVLDVLDVAPDKARALAAALAGALRQYAVGLQVYTAQVEFVAPAATREVAA